ncbi:hypothetical protein CRYUN_Cryun06bG0160800 [Craigia yunnanensis]
MVNGVRFDGPVMDANELEDGDLVVETCITRTLPPALTLEHGLQSIREAVEELKLNPPCSSSGLLRFQFCTSENLDIIDSSSKLVSLSILTRKIVFVSTPNCMFGVNATQIFLSNDSNRMSTYGFVDINFYTVLSSVNHKSGYFFIPLIELDELEDISILAATLAWSDSCLCTLEQAIVSYESALYQASSHFLHATERCHSECIRAAIRKHNVVEDKTVQMVYMNALSLGTRNVGAYPMELRGAPSFKQFCFKFSPTFAVASNMLDHASEMTYSIQDSANINSVWASLIVEECSRLGLTYFCVAPGSRSSPLALAASAHPFVTCISCFDERSLAFHAIGYARGSQKAAVIITTSGTAVSNLLPALVEASQDFVPLLVLSADRPPELQDCGANQSVSCLLVFILYLLVNHSGSFVRFFFSLPPPTNEIPARMVLTTLDSAVHRATSSPIGPVHINCPFREPLDYSPKSWKSSCLEGLDTWMSNAEPFTKYILVQHSYLCNNGTHGQMAEVLEKIQRVNKRLLLIGAICTEDEIWAILLLAKNLQWLVVADILSGLRLRKFLSSFPEVEENIFFVDYLDHALLSDSVRDSVQFDVIVQVGQGISFQVCAEHSLSEPYIAHIISGALSSESALFIGNSMVIRDADMYGCNWRSDNHSVADMMLKTELPWCNKRVCTLIFLAFLKQLYMLLLVLCVVGDISFLHDTKGLAILKQRMSRKPMTILVINNRGGTIFSLLPVADRTEPRVLNQYFYSSHNISIHKLCEAHGIPLCAPPTSSVFDHDHTRFFREGFILSLTLEDESTGCGLEMAILNAIAVSQGSSLLNILHPLKEKEEKSERLSSVRICALIDSSGTPEEVARRADPVEDAAVIQEVRKKVGCHIELRVDANRNWTYEQAIQFGFLVKDCNLQYIEEPVQDEDDIVRYCEESGLPVVLDETINNCPENPLNMLVKYSHRRIVALVSDIKLSLIKSTGHASFTLCDILYVVVRHC